jgi:hypothetical protein
VRGRLGAADDARLHKLAETRTSRQDAAEAAEAAPASAAAGPSEYERLIGKSLDGGLSPAEDARLNQLGEQRAIDRGLISPEDVSNPSDESE